MSFDEDKVRDSLSSRLDLIEPGLKFRKKEEFLPNHLGTRGFVDITAYDNDGRLVLIEVKKTGPATREALHEVLKYLEGAKSFLGLREDEIRIIIISLEWTELLVPFSSFCRRVTCQIEGYLAVVDSAGNVKDVEQVEPLPINLGRFISPWHELHYYSDRAALQEGLDSFEQFCKAAKIQDYVLLELKPSEDHPAGISSPKEGTMGVLLGQMAGLMGMQAQGQQELSLYQHILYFGMQMLSKEQCLANIRSARDDADDAIEAAADEEEETELCNLHGAVTEVEPRPISDFIEISYPAKLKSRLLDEDGWVVNHIHRFGSFARNTQLADSTILDELCGSQGSTHQGFDRTTNFCNPSEVAETVAGVNRCLTHNRPWRDQINKIVSDLASKQERRPGKISISNPSTGLLTFYLVSAREKPMGYIPNYTIILGNEDEKTVFFGCLRYRKNDIDLKQILDQHYEGSVMRMLASLSWGGYDERDVSVMRSVGLRYRSFMLDIKNGRKTFYEMTDEGWEECDAFHPFDDFMSVYKLNQNLIKEICELYSSRWSGGIIDFSGLT